MKWRNIQELDRESYSERVYFLVSDGKEIWTIYLHKETMMFPEDPNENEYEIENRLTHYSIIHKDIPLPNQPERSKRENEDKHCDTCFCVCNCPDGIQEPHHKTCKSNL